MSLGLKFLRSRTDQPLPVIDLGHLEGISTGIGYSNGVQLSCIGLVNNVPTGAYSDFYVIWESSVKGRLDLVHVKTNNMGGDVKTVTAEAKSPYEISRLLLQKDAELHECYGGFLSGMSGLTWTESREIQALRQLLSTPQADAKLAEAGLSG